jgi:hypothetical protein
MEAEMGTIWAWLFLAGTAGLFLSGIWMGVRGLSARHEPWLEFGHVPGGAGSYDVRYHAVPQIAAHAA